MVRAFVAEAEKESPFSDAELDACIKEMADINVLMRSEDIIYLIESDTRLNSFLDTYFIRHVIVLTCINNCYL